MKNRKMSTVGEHNKPKRILIIGGVAAERQQQQDCGRLDEAAEITILEKGKYVSFAIAASLFYQQGYTKKIKLITSNS